MLNRKWFRRSAVQASDNQTAASARSAMKTNKCPWSLRRNGGRASLPTRRPGRLFRAVAASSSGTGRLLGDQLLRCSSASQAQRNPIANVRRHPRQPPAPRVRRPVRGPVLGDGVPEAVPLLLPEVLRGVPVRAGGHLRQQGHLPLLQQLEDQEGRPQVPLAPSRPPRAWIDFPSRSCIGRAPLAGARAA